MKRFVFSGRPGPSQPTKLLVRHFQNSPWIREAQHKIKNLNNIVPIRKINQDASRLVRDVRYNVAKVTAGPISQLEKVVKNGYSNMIKNEPEWLREARWKVSRQASRFGGGSGGGNNWFNGNAVRLSFFHFVTDSRSVQVLCWGARVVS